VKLDCLGVWSDDEEIPRFTEDRSASRFITDNCNYNQIIGAYFTSRFSFIH